jgi:hypothetical protein
VIRPVVAIVPIPFDLRTLAKGKADEAEENDETNRCNNPIGHHLIRRLLEETTAQPYVSTTSHF